MGCGCEKKEGKAFPSAVVEINNPEQIVLLRKVVVPATLGDESSVEPVVGKYKNVILYYKANKHVYIYSSDGIPTYIETEIPQELLDRIADLEDEDVAINGRIDGVASDLASETQTRAEADASLGGAIENLDASLATVAKTGSYNDLSNRPTIGEGVLTIKRNGTTAGTFSANATGDTTVDISVPVVDRALDTGSDNPVSNSAISSALNQSIMTDISLRANASTTSVSIDGAKKNLYTGVASTKNVALPVASSTQAGVMNSATFDAVTANTNNLNAIMNGAVAITGIAASPSQADLTTAWQTETGLTTLINRAGIYDVDNNKVWTYYANAATWYAASNTSQVTVSTFTNNSEGVIRGSTNVGQVFAENDGTGSVNGWDNLANTVATNTSDISDLRSAMPTVNNATLTIQNNGTNVATFTANSATDTTANIISPVDIGSVLSTPTNVAYVGTNNIIDGAVTGDKIDFSTLSGNYSTNEQPTGYTWVDGSPIYKKTISTGQLPSAPGEKVVAHGITDVSVVVRIEGVARNAATGQCYPIPYLYATDPASSIGVAVAWGNVVITVATDRSAITESYVTLYYTKNNS